jgi:molybdopterin-containing oxidoreductase family membrane subunit
MSKPGVLGVFAHIDAAVEAIKTLQARGYEDLVVYSPLPRHELEDALGQPESPVRMWTLIGGLSGLATAIWLTMWTSLDWPLVVGGKTIPSIPPYVVIMFELTVLFGALATLAGLAFNALFAWRKTGSVAYDPRFTDDKIGVFVACETTRRDEFRQLLTAAGAEEVQLA